MLENLCLACFLCNRNKGSDIASYTATGALTPFFHPRQQKWHEHLVIRGNRIEPLAGGGEVTVRLLAFNTPDLCEEREGLQEIGRYPSGGDPI